MTSDVPDTTPAVGPVFFFQHVMKTAGTSFAPHLRRSFPADQIYPSPDTPQPTHQEQYWKIAPLRELTEQERRTIRVYHGHFPFLVADMVGADVTLTMLREPIERTISHMRHCRRHFPAHADKSFEEIYEDGWLHPLFFRNYQVKQFALTAADRPKAHNEDIVIDRSRLDLGVANLERVDILGLTEHYGEFVAEVVSRYGWRAGHDRRLQVGTGPDQVSDALRSRIVADNWADLEFYERAREIHAERRSRAG